jgi:4,5-dihydroxyphthalate decarboxylase
MPGSPVPVTLAIRDYDYVAPLALGDVAPDGVALTLVRAFDAIERMTADPAIDGGESSFSQYVRRLAAGDRTWVGLPLFVMREFRHRCFFVRRGSGLTDVAHLAGKRVGTDAWGASGNTWSRGILRARGVALDGIRWTVGPVDPGQPAGPPGPLPPWAAPAPPGRSLAELLAAGELDALMCPWPPAGFERPDAPIVRLYADYRRAEQEYFRETGLFPAHHVVVLKRPLVDRHPEVVGPLYDAFCRARTRSQANHRVLHESSPWLLADLEEQAALMGPDYRADGYRENRAMVAAFCAEQHAQGLVAAPIDPDTVFAEFERLTGR